MGDEVQCPGGGSACHKEDLAMTTRRAAVAGQFYPGSAREIRRDLAGLVDDDVAKERALGVMGPHAGWMYSGRGAGILYSRVEVPATVVALCPNHRGLGARAAIMSDGGWELPTGEVALDSRLAGLLKEECGFLVEDSRAHATEHSLEVHLPFLQRFRPDFKLVPISLGRLSYEEVVELGEGLARAVESFGRKVLVVASSDMTHFESAPSAKAKDEVALGLMTKLDPERLYRTVLGQGITMCGVIPAAAMLVYALRRGATEARVIDYRNSGDVTGDYGDVVAYASVIVK
jgi:hypothetical protein